MDRKEALKRISELSCAYQHIRMTECPHCAAEVESLVRSLTAPAIKEKQMLWTCKSCGDNEKPKCPKCTREDGLIVTDDLVED